MSDKQQPKRPAKGILKNSSSFDKEAQHPHPGTRVKSKETKWDEMNIIATLHPSGKDYGHMKIDEPKTPYNYDIEDQLDGLDANELAEKIKLSSHTPAKIFSQDSDDDSEEEELTEEEKQQKREFELKRKQHYNEFYALQLAKKLLEEEDEDDEEDKPDCGRRPLRLVKTTAKPSTLVFALDPSRDTSDDDQKLPAEERRRRKEFASQRRKFHRDSFDFRVSQTGFNNNCEESEAKDSGKSDVSLASKNNIGTTPVRK